MLILAYFGPKNNCMVKMTTPYPSPYCALSSCKILGKIMNRFLDNCKSLQKKGKKGAINADFRLFLTFFIFGPFLLILNQKINSKFQNKILENLTNLKNWAQKC